MKQAVKDRILHLMQWMVSHMFEEFGQVPPTVFMFTENSNAVAVELKMANEQEKDESATKIRQHLEHDENIVAVVFVAESWRVIKDPDEVGDIFKVRPSLDPKREEGVMISFEAKSGEHESLWATILRNPDRLEPPEIVPSTMMTGRFCNLFPHAETKH